MLQRQCAELRGGVTPPAPYLAELCRAQRARVITCVQRRMFGALVALSSAAAPLPHAATANSSVEYFGFWGPDAPSAMAAFTNLAFANDPAEACTLHAHGIHSLLKVESLFVDPSVRWQFKLRPDYLTRWQAAVPAFEPLLRNGTALGFFLGDELPWNGLPFAQVQTIARTVRASFPGA